MALKQTTVCCVEGHINEPGRMWCIECGALIAGIIIDDYRVLSCIGQGSDSAVYLVEQRSLNNRKVVIKILQQSSLEPDIDKFRREAELLASLSHPYILPIYAYGVIHDHWALSAIYAPYLVVQYAEQGSLEDVFAREGRCPWSLERVVSMAKEIGEALDYAHSRGVLHRDVKPANLLQIGSHVLLSDFSVASLIDAEKSYLNAPWAGSPAYMAPEVWKHRPGRYSDQYALAVTCFCLLTGNYPWESNGSTSHWSHLHRSITPRSLKEFRQDVPAAVDVVLQRALAKDPHERYPTVHEFSAALFVAAQEVTQDPVTRHPMAQAAQLRAAPLDDRTDRKEWQHSKDGVNKATARVAPIYKTRTTQHNLSGAEIPPGMLEKEQSQPIEVDTDSLSSSQRSDRWMWGALLLNLFIGVLLAVQTYWQNGNVAAAADLMLALSPSLLIGPLLALTFQQVPLKSLWWGIFWGMFFGITDVLVCTLACYCWTALILTIPHWGYDWIHSGDGLYIFWREILNLAPVASSLALLSLGMAGIGGALTGLICERGVGTMRVCRQGC